MATVRDLCKGEVIVIDTSASIEQAAVLMDRKSVGFLVVSSREGIPVGVVTDRDISTRAVGRALDVANLYTSQAYAAKINVEHDFSQMA